MASHWGPNQPTWERDRIPYGPWDPRRPPAIWNPTWDATYPMGSVEYLTLRLRYQSQAWNIGSPPETAWTSMTT
eukprot:CAMPEP_0184227952 /NCGR_PEP_ID=MMETSP0976-20121227/21511_1 /TAXON_ID=483370 /ORGANISM="non described non described, Strain CCMP2097" /LENGTH=73 /DNA_ID=CAMNT_0026532905 /DNA_START=26 /DNA_END=244 /DNA_ORIENTATION=+